MKNIFILTLIGLISINLAIASEVSEALQLSSAETKFIVKQSDGNSFSCRNSISSVEMLEVTTKSGNFVKLVSENYVGTKEYGAPELPVLSKLVEIPIDAEIAIIVKSYTEEIIDLGTRGINNMVFPAQPSLSKSQEPEDVSFYFNSDVYSTDEFIDNPIAVIDKLGTMRGVQLGRLRIHPVQYNPVRNQLRILNDLEIEVEFYNADYNQTKSQKHKYYSPIFNQNFANVINFNNTASKELIQVAPLKYVIVADPMFQVVLQPFVAWKTKKGFNVVEAYTNDPAVGNTTTTIKAFLQNEYTSATAQDPAPSFILFVGDVAQIPAFSGTTGGHVTDLYYCEYDGAGDIYPEVYYGRFSATNNEELQAQIDKTLEYEQFLMPNTSFLAEVVMVAGVDASMASTYGNGQINYGTDNYFNLAHGITSHTYLYPASGSSAAQIIADISAGVSFANYTAHCSAAGWADPSFTTSNVPSLNNAHEYPLMIGNCCSSVEFQQNECFGEAVLRAEEKGALGYIGGSNSTYWNEDFWWGVGNGSISANPTYAATSLGAYDGLFHDNGEAISNWYVTNGQIVQCGNLAVTTANGAEDYYWEIYHLMGDPSVTTYLGIPAPITCSHYAAIPVGTANITVTTEVHAYVAISKDGVLLDAGIADATGIVVLEFDPIMMVGPADIVATKQNREPYIGTVELIINNAPFVVYTDHSIDDSQANNNGNADYTETVSLNVTLNNLGTVNASNVSATLSTADSCITITQDTAIFGNIAASSALSLNSVFELSVAQYFEDQHTVPCVMDVTDGNDTWTSNFSITVNSPKMEIENISFDDSTGGNNNQRFDAGEVVFISYDVNNAGHAASLDAFSYISSTSSYIEILTDSFALGTLAPMMPVQVNSIIVIDPATPIAELVSLNFNAISGLYSDDDMLESEVGLIAEDWESNSFLSYAWENNSNTPWVITSTETYEGDFAAHSGAIGNSSSTTLQITIDVAVADNVSFYKKVSCEEPGWSGFYDYLEFFIDGISQDQWGGEVAWSQETYPLTAGSHTLKWVYQKDSYATGGEDRAWVDFIEFPLLNGMQNNNAPEFTSTDSTSAVKGTPYSYTLTTYDADGDNVSLSSVVLPGWLSFIDNGNGTGTLSGTPTGFDIYTHQVIISASDGFAFTPHLFEIEVEAIVGIDENISVEYFNIYPNPAYDLAFIKFNLKSNDNASLTILNTLGEIVNSELSLQGIPNQEQTVEIDIRGFEPGIYFCRLETQGQILTKKLIITK